MRVEGHHRGWDAHDEAGLEQVLRFRDAVGGALFWLVHDDHRHPSMAIRISGNLADVHYFPDEGHPGFRALAEPAALGARTTTFIYEGCDPATGEETPSQFVVPVSKAIDVAKDFHRTGARSSAVSWFEL
jgi:hypothetical protein